MPNPVVFLQGSDQTAFNSTVTKSATLTNVAGNLGIVVAQTGNTAATLSLGADTNGNTWVALTPANSTQGLVQAWYCLSLKVGSNTVTITDSVTGSATRGVIFAEWTVTSGTVAFDKQAAHGQTATTQPATPTSGTLSSAAEIVIGYFQSGTASQTFTINGSGTVEYTTAHTTVNSCITDLYVSATTAVTQSVNQNSATSANGIATFAFTTTPIPSTNNGYAPLKITFGSELFGLFDL